MYAPNPHVCKLRGPTTCTPPLWLVVPFMLGRLTPGHYRDGPKGGGGGRMMTL